MTHPVVKYMEKTRRYYEAQGFERPYQWAKHDDTPFHKLIKPLDQCTVAMVTTAVPDGSIPKLSRVATSHPIEELPDEFDTEDLSWDKEATHTRDISTFIPLPSLVRLLDDGVIGHLAPRFHFVPTDYSQTNTNTKDAPAILAACIQDEVDVVILTPL